MVQYEQPSPFRCLLNTCRRLLEEGEKRHYFALTLRSQLVLCIYVHTFFTLTFSLSLSLSLSLKHIVHSLSLSLKHTLHTHTLSLSLRNISFSMAYFNFCCAWILFANILVRRILWKKENISPRLKKSVANKKCEEKGYNTIKITCFKRASAFTKHTYFY